MEKCTTIWLITTTTKLYNTRFIKLNLNVGLLCDIVVQKPKLASCVYKIG